MDKLIQIQENLFDYFKDVDDTIFIEFVDCFAYESTTDNEEVSKLSEQFIDDNGLADTIVNINYDKNHPASFFKRTQLSQSSMYDNIRTALISISHNRFRKSIFDRKIDDIDNKIERSEKIISNLKSDLNIKSFNFLKNNLLACFETLNRSDHYFYSEKDDAKLVKRITELEFEK